MTYLNECSGYYLVYWVMPTVFTDGIERHKRPFLLALFFLVSLIVNSFAGAGGGDRYKSDLKATDFMT